jgi:hypothetical protein
VREEERDDKGIGILRSYSMINLRVNPYPASIMNVGEFETNMLFHPWLA